MESASLALSPITIPMRVFSASPSLGAKASSVSDRKDPNYGALMVFIDKVAAYTGNAVNFSMTSWAATAPNTVIQQVGIDGDGRDAAYDSGTSLNPVWGFVFNSSIPFGLSFDRMVEFLYDDGGLALAQSLVDARGLNVKLLPVVGSTPQTSGYFKHPIGDAKCQSDSDCKRETPIGLEGLCQAGWVWRYLPPAQNVLDGACAQLVSEGVIPSKNISFVASIAGQSVLRSVQLGAITAFEFATALDDYDPPPAGTGFFPPLSTENPVPSTSQNPGHRGLRFAHFPSWHQPFFIGWLMVNKTSVWNNLAPESQVAIEQAAKDALAESQSSSKSLQCKALKNILQHNDGQVQLQLNGTPLVVNGKTVSADIKLAEWPDAALDRLKTATDVYLELLKGGTSPTPDQLEYRTVIAAHRSYMQQINYVWDPLHFDIHGECGL
ncbi:MAG TPA: hypothetical protein VF550_03805 [Polyangia bacterium]